MLILGILTDDTKTKRSTFLHQPLKADFPGPSADPSLLVSISEVLPRLSQDGIPFSNEVSQDVLSNMQANYTGCALSILQLSNSIPHPPSLPEVGEFRAIPPLQEQIKGMASCPLIIRQ
jgi:hypothetical protein